MALGILGAGWKVFFFFPFAPSGIAGQLVKFQACLIRNNCKPLKQCQIFRREEEDESLNDRCRCLFWLCDACEKKWWQQYSKPPVEYSERRRTGALIKNISCWGNRGGAAQTLERLPVHLPRREFQFAPRVRSCPACLCPATSLVGGRRTEIGSDCLELFRVGSRHYDTICQSPWRGDKRFAKSHRVCSQASKRLWGFFFFFWQETCLPNLVENLQLFVSGITSAKLQPQSHSKRPRSNSNNNSVIY